MIYKPIWAVELLIIWITIVPLNLQALESCSEIDPNNIERFYGPPPTDVEPESLPLELRCSSVNEAIVFLPTPEAVEEQRAVLERHGMGTSPAFQEGRIGVTVQIAPAIVERAPLLLSYCLEVGKICEPLLVWDSTNLPGSSQDQVGYTDFLRTQKISRTGAKSIYADLLLPPDLVEQLRPQVAIPQAYLIRLSVADSTEIKNIGVEVATVRIVDVPDDTSERTRNAKNKKSQKNGKAEKGVDNIIKAEFELKFANDIITPYLIFGGKAGSEKTKIGMWILGDVGLQFNFLGDPTGHSIVYGDIFLGKDSKEDGNSNSCRESVSPVLSPNITLKLLGIDIGMVSYLVKALKKCRKKKRSRSALDIQIPVVIEVAARLGYGYSFDIPIVGEITAFIGGKGTVGLEGLVKFPSLTTFEILNLGPFGKLAAIAEAELDILGSIGAGITAELELVKEHFALDIIIHLDDKPMVGMIKNILQGPSGAVTAYVKIPIWGREEIDIIEWDSGLRRIDILKIWPEELTKVSNTFRYTGLTKIDAACGYNDDNEDGKIHLFEDQYFAKYNDKHQSGRGWPKVIPESLPGLWTTSLTDGIDACVNGGSGMIYFFKGNEYIKFYKNKGVAKKGYPVLIEDELSGFSEWNSRNFDAVVNGDGVLYFFKGSEYIQHGAQTFHGIGNNESYIVNKNSGSFNKGASGSAQPISTRFPGVWPDGITAALNIDNQIYFFKDDQYLVFDLKTNQVVEKAKQVTEGWTMDTSYLPASFKPYTPAPPPKCKKVYDARIKPKTESTPVSWDKATGTHIPDSAFEAAINADGTFLYICRIDEKTTGQIDTDGCKILGAVKQQYEVLRDNTSLSWQFASGGKRLAGAVKGDICRARYGSDYYVGNVNNGCKIPVDGVGKIIKHYEMLVN